MFMGPLEHGLRLSNSALMAALPCVVVRYRAFMGGPRTLREFLLVGGVDGLTWPAGVPPRFLSRVKRALLVPPRDCAHAVEVDSAAHAAPPLRARDDVLRGGIWVVDDDFAAAGGVEELGVVPRVSVFGIPVDPAAVALFHRVRDLLPPSGVHVRAVYHGTDAAALPSIARDGLVPSEGMLGAATYLGTFFKAVRYASRTQEYARRKLGAVVRAYLDPGRVAVMTDLARPCGCTRCEETRDKAARYAARAGLPPDYDKERTMVCDHLMKWARAHDTAFVPVTKCSGGGKTADGKPMYVVKNEEWAVARPKERLDIQCFALLDMDSVAWPDWDPLQRNQRIL